MSKANIRKGCLWAVLIYIALAVLFALIGGDQLKFNDSETGSVHALAPVGELTQGMELCQPLTAQGEELLGVSIQISTYERQNTCHLSVQLEDANGQVLAQQELSCADLTDNAVQWIGFDTPVSVLDGEQYRLILTSPDGSEGNAVTVWYGNTMQTVRASIAVELHEGETLTVNGEALDGLLCYTATTRSYSWFGQVYWYCVAVLGVLLVVYCLLLIRAVENGKKTFVLYMIGVFQKYGYLLKQLVSRDFKTKYKRSVLGVCWSFLNPLLTMLVQYIVFSTLFKTDIENFALYLLCGIVCYSFFSEASNMALQSIVGNASLITKVYVPKYIYPLSRVLSSTVNLLLSFVPLFLVMLLTRTWVKPAILLLPFSILCLFAFSLGIGLILASMMVFFRDTQFLWSVISMLWMYVTPIFYPESIIPTQFLPLFKCNPLYHIIRFVRTILIDGVSPEPMAYALCILVSAVPLLLGGLIFKKTQDKFIMNL